jgi:hypothetical protein
MSAGTASADILLQQQPHVGGSVALASCSIPSGRGGGGGSGGIEMSCPIDRHSSETEGSSDEGGTFAGVIGASGRTTIRSSTMVERSRMQDMVRQQKEVVEHAAAVLVREGATIVHEQPWGLSSRSEPGKGPPAPAVMPHLGEKLVSSVHAFEVQGASRSEPGIGDEDLIGSVLQEADITNFYSEFEAELDA